MMIIDVKYFTNMIWAVTQHKEADVRLNYKCY